MTSKKARTIVIEGRVDVRSLAAIAKVLNEHGIVIRSRSHLVSTIIEAYCELLIGSGAATRVELSATALEILAQIGIEFANTRRRNLIALSKKIGNERAVDSLIDASTGLLPQTDLDRMIAEAEAKLDEDE
ncbi:hypothetical protein LCGC14_0600890 [marine sediment metagenome]|uniref:Uncharacterized protein n=1 Tax=marine sediment metagenome TaxID=412755 RepID=A0A0F9UJ27_9ZZZZ